MMRTNFSRGLTALLCSTTMVGSAASQSPSTDLVVTPKWLASHLQDPNLVILQVGPRETYTQGHIAGSRFIDLQDIAVPEKDEKQLALEMPEASDLKARLEKFGISDGSRIVVVQSDEWFSPSTRVMFTLYYAGLGDRSSWLDGGLAAWKQAGLPTTADVPSVTPGRITKAANPSLIVDHTFVEALASPRAGTHLIDGRAPVFFEGPGHERMKAGHIPGATNLPFNTLVGENQRLLSTAELTEKFAAAGVQPSDTVVAYCHIGQQATMVLFAARLLGHPTRLYDGSMDDWGKRNLPTIGAKP